MHLSSRVKLVGQGSVEPDLDPVAPVDVQIVRKSFSSCRDSSVKCRHVQVVSIFNMPALREVTAIHPCRLSCVKLASIFKIETTLRRNRNPSPAHADRAIAGISLLSSYDMASYDGNAIPAGAAWRFQPG